MEEDQQIAIGFDVELADKTIVQVVMSLRIYADVRHSLAFDRVKSFAIKKVMDSFRLQIEEGLKTLSYKTDTEDKADG